MTDAKHTPEPWMPTAADMPEAVSGGKRCNVVRNDISDDYPWWTGHGKDESCSIEGTPCHWHWLAFQIVGLVPIGSEPYSEEKPLPFSKAYVQSCVNALRGLDVEKVEALLDAVRAESESLYNDKIPIAEHSRRELARIRAGDALRDSIRAGGGA